MSRLSFSSAANDAGAVTPSHMVSDNHVDGRHVFARSLVGNRLLDANAGTKVPSEVEADMDRHIADMAAKAVQARHDGDAHGAALYIRRMVKAIHLQISAAREIDADPCYFSAMGEAARLAQEDGGA